MLLYVLTEMYLEPSQTYMMEIFEKIVNGCFFLIAMLNNGTRKPSKQPPRDVS